MQSAFGIEHGEISKIAVKRPPGKLKKIKTEAVLATAKANQLASYPTPLRLPNSVPRFG